ncbi:hypothetical protein UWK_01115 [Desulfocapsa sulfexigens DSM 10523]|uniref:Uncharacterized protein n=1 Tax=Desulfocapsa sulfexigens (strain DSM 10523 / SB164P1) TaxID=1167006 RepID=M1P2G8_DESSD|nr:hypothetical protein UWK_01115 [Desulfocapsa sulfexigens DSM 10523]
MSAEKVRDITICLIEFPNHHSSSAYPSEEEFFRVDYMGICGLDGRSRAPRDGFMASHIIDTEKLRVANVSEVIS